MGFREARRVGLIEESAPIMRLKLLPQDLNRPSADHRLRPAHIRPVYILLEELSELVLVLGQTELAANCALVRELDLRRRIKVRERVLPCQHEGRATVLQEDTAGN